MKNSSTCSVFAFAIPICNGSHADCHVLGNIIRTEIRLRKAGLGGIKGKYKSLSSSGFGHSSINRQQFLQSHKGLLPELWLRAQSVYMS